jgi:hypothetical protein
VYHSRKRSSVRSPSCARTCDRYQFALPRHRFAVPERLDDDHPAVESSVHR